MPRIYTTTLLAVCTFFACVSCLAGSDEVYDSRKLPLRLFHHLLSNEQVEILSETGFSDEDRFSMVTTYRIKGTNNATTTLIRNGKSLTYRLDGKRVFRCLEHMMTPPSGDWCRALD